MAEYAGAYLDVNGMINYEKSVIKLNINDSVRVKLTESGMKVLDKKYNENQKRHVCQFDKNGYFTAQIWQLFAIFGEDFAMYAPQMFEMNEILAGGLE